MLINTVILFLRDALPIFIIFSIFISIFSATIKRKNWIGFGIAFGLTSSIFLLISMNVISDMYEGVGYEIFVSIITIINYFFIVLLACLSKRSLDPQGNVFIFLIVSTSLTFMVNGADFLIFISSYWATPEHAKSLSLGIILGSGICFSISILIYFFSRYLQLYVSEIPTRIFLILFATGQLAKVTILLTQADILPSTTVAWNTQHLIADSKELGHLMSSLFGYEATPSILHICVYLLGSLIPLVIIFRKFNWHDRLINKALD